jgi:F-type H+-transporting ATPase subunit a
MEGASEPIHVILKLSLFGIDISVTSAVLVIWFAVTVIFILTYLAVRKASIVPGKLQNLIEILYEFWHSQIHDLFQEETIRWLPFIFSLFTFILVCNLLGMIPGVYPISANLNNTVTMAVIVFFVYHIAGIKKNGLWIYLKSFVPEGLPLYLVPMVVFVEFLSHLIRPFSLALRLFANMTAGHAITITILSMIFIFKNIWLAGFPLLGSIVIRMFEIFVAFIQAYVFAYLSALYIGLAISEET